MTVKEMLDCKTEEEFNTKTSKELDRYRILGSDANCINLINDTEYKEFDRCWLRYSYKTGKANHLLFDMENKSECIRIPKFIKWARVPYNAKYITGYGRNYVSDCDIQIGKFGLKLDSLSIDIKDKVRLLSCQKYCSLTITGRNDDNKAALIFISETSLNTFNNVTIKGRVMVHGAGLVDVTPNMRVVLHSVLKKYKGLNCEGIKTFGISNGIMYVTWDIIEEGKKSREYTEIYNEEAFDYILRNSGFVIDNNREILGEINYE